MVRGKRDCVYGRGPILTRESIRMAIGPSDLFPVALVGCQCSCMASKRRASFIYFYQEKFSGDRSSPLDPMRPTQLDKGLIIQISGIGCKLSFLSFGDLFFHKFNWGRKREKFKLAFCLFVESLSIIPKASAHTYLRCFVPTRECTILFIAYICLPSRFTIKITRIKAGTHRVHPPVHAHTWN